MKVHPNVVEIFLNFVRNHSGHSDRSKLRTKFENLALSIYKKQDGTIVLVDTERYITETRNQGGETRGIAAFMMHSTAVDKLMKLEELYGGYANEAKLKKFYSELDFTMYNQVTTNETILVTTSDYMDAIRGAR
jgi:hypothetical protein